MHARASKEPARQVTKSEGRCARNILAPCIRTSIRKHAETLVPHSPSHLICACGVVVASLLLSRDRRALPLRISIVHSINVTQHYLHFDVARPNYAWRNSGVRIGVLGCLMGISIVQSLSIFNIIYKYIIILHQQPTTNKLY
jgi:hypothetical protein